eukprot:scaffold8_cov249-Pinguiococcus_pyrenoidosus.AAC.11
MRNGLTLAQRVDRVPACDLVVAQIHNLEFATSAQRRRQLADPVVCCAQFDETFGTEAQVRKLLEAVASQVDLLQAVKIGQVPRVHPGAKSIPREHQDSEAAQLLEPLGAFNLVVVQDERFQRLAGFQRRRRDACNAISRRVERHQCLQAAKSLEPLSADVVLRRLQPAEQRAGCQDSSTQDGKLVLGHIELSKLRQTGQIRQVLHSAVAKLQVGHLRQRRRVCAADNPCRHQFVHCHLLQSARLRPGAFGHGETPAVTDSRALWTLRWKLGQTAESGAMK